MKAFIGYHFFHGAGKIAPTAAYAKTHHAMSLFTDQKFPNTRAFTLDMRDDQEGGPLEPLFRDLCVRYGAVSGTTRGVYLGGEHDFRAHHWALNAEQFEQAFPYLHFIHQEIPQSRERTRLHASWSFKFVDPDTQLLLPDQEEIPEIDIRLGPGSSLNLATGGKTSVNAWFLFPFESASEEFNQYVARLQRELIFKFSAKHWRLWKRYPKRGLWPKKFVPSWYGI
jgi:hypothetical protein